MNDNDIREAWQTLTNEDTPPQEFLAIVNAYRKRKNVFFPVKFTIDDFAVCSMFYEMRKAFAKHTTKTKDSKTEEPNG